MSDYINLFYSVYIHLFLLFVFLSIFFWTVISKTESRSINNEITRSVNAGLKNFKIPSQYVTDSNGSYLLGLYQGQDITVSRNNDQLFQMNIIIAVLIFIGLLATIYVRYAFCGKLFDIFEVLGENGLILIMVGAIEYYFFTRIASKYVPVKPSYLPSVVKEKLNSMKNK